MNRRAWIGIFAAATAMAYVSAIGAPFEYDDIPAIVQNTSIRQLRPLSVPLNPPAMTPVTGRPAVNLSLAINYALNDLLSVDQRPDPYGPNKTIGYHVVNILLHLGCGLLIFGIIGRTARHWSGDDPSIDAAFIAGMATLLWLLHPIQTEAVDYIIQRTELLVSVCYAAALYASIRAWDSATRGRRRGLYVTAIAASIVGMLSKEVMITAPVTILVYDRVFRADSWKALFANRGRVQFHAALFATALIVVVSTLTGARSRSVGFDLGITWYQYFYTQAWAVARYLRLIVWPSGLTFDYGDKPIAGLAGLPGVILLIALAALTLAAFRRARLAWIGFAGVWFFLILAPSSSVIPIRTEVAAERRVYLASAAIFAALVAGVEWWRRRAGWKPIVTRIGFGLVAAAFGIVTFGRGLTYGSSERLYRDTIEKAPANARAQLSLGLALMQQGPDRFEEAAETLRRAVEMDSTNFVAWRSLGLLESYRGNWREAATGYGHFVRMRPDNLEANDGTARALLHLNEPDAAMTFVEKTGTADPELLWMLGQQLVQRNRGGEAVRYLEAAAGLGSPPSLGVALLSLAYAQDGRAGDARKAASLATTAAGDTADVFELAGRAMAAIKDPVAAKVYLQRAIQLNPSSASAKSALAAVNGRR